jgi:hypothetical protein
MRKLIEASTRGAKQSALKKRQIVDFVDKFRTLMVHDWYDASHGATK